MKKLIAFILLCAALLTLCSCGGGKLKGVYAIKYFDGYSFSPDGTVIYYESNWEKSSDAPLKCKPEFWYGTSNVNSQ